MKRAILIGAAVAAVVLAAAGAAFGPGLLAGRKFETAYAAHFAQVEAEGGPQLQDGCVLCHGPGGQSRNAQYPALAGQPAAYIEAQLHAFAQGRRHSPQMGSLAASLSEAQIKSLAAYFARQVPDRNDAVALDAKLEAEGKAQVAAGNCAACHGEGLTGTPIAPRLAGQGEAYLADQLAAFKRGERHDPTETMNALAGQMSPAQIKASARYVASLSAGAGR